MGRRIFSKEYKLQITRQVIKEGKRINEVSESLGITEQTIYRRLREYDKYDEEAFKGFGNARVDSQYKIKLLKKKNKQLEQGNEILKKFRVFQKGRQKKRCSYQHEPGRETMGQRFGRGIQQVIKSDLVDKKHPFKTRDLARKEVFEYIEMFYNPKRLHSA